MKKLLGIWLPGSAIPGQTIVGFFSPQPAAVVNGKTLATPATPMNRWGVEAFQCAKYNATIPKQRFNRAEDYHQLP